MAVHRITGDGTGAAVAARVGDVIVVTLPEMAGAGYQWQVAQAVPSWLEVLPEAGSRTMSDAPGASALRDFRLRVAGKGHAMVALAHCRAWEGVAAASRTFLLDVEAS